MDLTIILAATTMFLMAIFFSYVLGWANVKFAVEVNPKVELVLAALPGANCGGCGLVGCGDYANAVVLKNEAINKCSVGGADTANAIAQIMGVAAGEVVAMRPIVHCNAKKEDKQGRGIYLGEKTCAAANFVSGYQGCVYGCLGLGDCVSACKYNALKIENDVVIIDYNLCIGCGACSKACPRKVISMVPFKQDKVLAVFCSNKESASAVKDVCSVGCIGCSICAKKSNTFEMKEGLAVVNYNTFYQNPENLEEAIEKCPSKIIGYTGKAA